MIAIRSRIGFSSGTESYSPRNHSRKPAGNLVRGNEPVHGGMETMGSILVGGRTTKRTVGEVVPTKSTVGSDSLGTESIAERECGA